MKPGEIFVFSPRNKSRPNEMTQVIIDYMNSNFKEFNNAGTAGRKIEVDTAVFAEWIVGHYEEKSVRYVISHNDGYVIFPIRKFGEYFKITASYRTKKSGSGTPAKKDVDTVKQVILGHYASAKFRKEQKKLFVEINERLSMKKFKIGEFSYYLSEQGENEFEIRRLSNTRNMNVIFSIALIKPQDKNDLAEFEADL